MKERSQIDAFSLKTLSVLVWMEMPKRIEIFCVSNRKRSSSVDGAKLVIKKKKKCCLKLRRKTFKGIGTKICNLGCAISVKEKLEIKYFARHTFSDVAMLYGVNQSVTSLQAYGCEIKNRRHSTDDVKDHMNGA